MTRVHRNVFSWGWDLLREKKRYKDWRSWLVNARNRVIMVAGRNRGQAKPILAVNYRGLDAPVFVRLGTPDLWVLDEVFNLGEYRAVVQNELGGVKQIVDLGANAGMSIRFWLRQWPDARVIGVEPDESNFRVASLNAAQHRDGTNVSMVRACVAASARTVTLDRTDHESKYTMRDGVAGAGADAVTVPALPLEQILDSCGALRTIDLLKVDIEGAEREVFRASAPWIGRVRHIVVEVHPPYTVEEMLADLEASGGRFQVIERHPSPPNEVAFLKAEPEPV